MVVGYSSHKPLAEEWKIEIVNGNLKVSRERKENEIGITWNGELEAINRIYAGYSLNLPHFMEKEGIEEEKIHKILENVSRNGFTTMVMPAMPIQDAIDLARFLVETTINFVKFVPGAPTVGGPVEIAAITKHEDFKWVSRKHYYDSSLNPKEGEEYGKMGNK